MKRSLELKKSYIQTIKASEAVHRGVPENETCICWMKYIRWAMKLYLIYEATGRVVRPGGLPIEQGVAVFNVETIYNVYRAV